VLDLADCRGLGADSLRNILCGNANLALLEGLVLDGIGEVLAPPPPTHTHNSLYSSAPPMQAIANTEVTMCSAFAGSAWTWK